MTDEAMAAQLASQLNQSPAHSGPRSGSVSGAADVLMTGMAGGMASPRGTSGPSRPGQSVAGYPTFGHRPDGRQLEEVRETQPMGPPTHEATGATQLLLNINTGHAHGSEAAWMDEVRRIVQHYAGNADRWAALMNGARRPPPPSGASGRSGGAPGSPRPGPGSGAGSPRSGGNSPR